MKKRTSNKYEVQSDSKLFRRKLNPSNSTSFNSTLSGTKKFITYIFRHPPPFEWHRSFYIRTISSSWNIYKRYKMPNSGVWSGKIWEKSSPAIHTIHLPSDYAINHDMSLPRPESAGKFEIYHAVPAIFQSPRTFWHTDRLCHSFDSSKQVAFVLWLICLLGTIESWLPRKEGWNRFKDNGYRFYSVRGRAIIKYHGFLR